MGKKLILILSFVFTMVIISSLAACGSDSPVDSVGGADAGAGSVTEITRVEDMVPEGAPRFELIAQAYQGRHIVELPQLVSDDPSESLSDVNMDMLAFAGDYGSYLATEGSESWLELKCYPYYAGSCIGVVMTRAECPPADGSYGEVAGFLYDYKEDRRYTLEDVITEAGLDRLYAEEALLAALPENTEMDSFRIAAFALSADDEGAGEDAEAEAANSRYIFFFDVFLSAPDGELSGGRSLYIRLPNGSYEPYNGSSLASAFHGGNLLSLDPPLEWAQSSRG
jgi:hypothetical protein